METAITSKTGWETLDINNTNYWLFSVDLAEGNGGDYSVINIFKIEIMDRSDFKKVLSPCSFTEFFRLRSVGTGL